MAPAAQSSRVASLAPVPEPGANDVLIEAEATMIARAAAG
jgi:hypothetical protein